MIANKCLCDGRCICTCAWRYTACAADLTLTLTLNLCFSLLHTQINYELLVMTLCWIVQQQQPGGGGKGPSSDPSAVLVFMPGT